MATPYQDDWNSLIVEISSGPRVWMSRHGKVCNSHWESTGSSGATPQFWMIPLTMPIHEVRIWEQTNLSMTSSRDIEDLSSGDILLKPLLASCPTILASWLISVHWWRLDLLESWGRSPSLLWSYLECHDSLTQYWLSLAEVVNYMSLWPSVSRRERRKVTELSKSRIVINRLVCHSNETA